MKRTLYIFFVAAEDKIALAMLYNGMNRAQNPDSSELFQGYSYSDKGKDTEMYD